MTVEHPASVGPDQYRCACCGDVFNKGWSDEEALAEKALIFPDVPIEDCGLVCDDCFRLIGAHAAMTSERSKS